MDELVYKKLRGVIEMFLRRYQDDIREKTAGMNRKEKVSYVITYYWYHILIIISIIALIFFTVRFYVFGNHKPEFTCVLVNQEIDEERDAEIAQAFAKENGSNPFGKYVSILQRDEGRVPEPGGHGYLRVRDIYRRWESHGGSSGKG